MNANFGSNVAILCNEVVEKLTKNGLQNFHDVILTWHAGGGGWKGNLLMMCHSSGIIHFSSRPVLNIKYKLFIESSLSCLILMRRWITFCGCSKIMPYSTELEHFQAITVPFHILPSNFVVEWLTLLLRIREVPGSNLGSETGYTDWGFSWFSSVLPSECRDSALKLGYDRFLPRPF
jgi:hypothetical protein